VQVHAQRAPRRRPERQHAALVLEQHERAALRVERGGPERLGAHARRRGGRVDVRVLEQA
jgi:hypothetical protein